MTRRFDDFRHVGPPFGPDEGLIAGVFALLGALLIGAVLAMVLFWPRPAHARWTGTVSDPAIAAWYKNQHNEKGEWCCDDSDGHPFFGDYTINEDGSVTLEGRTLPAYMVLKGANPTGHAVWWFTDAGGEHRDYCFAPGTLS